MEKVQRSDFQEIDEECQGWLRDLAYGLAEKAMPVPAASDGRAPRLRVIAGGGPRMIDDLAVPPDVLTYSRRPAGRHHRRDCAGRHRRY